MSTVEHHHAPLMRKITHRYYKKLSRPTSRPPAAIGWHANTAVSRPADRIEEVKSSILVWVWLKQVRLCPFVHSQVPDKQNASPFKTKNVIFNLQCEEEEAQPPSLPCSFDMSVFFLSISLRQEKKIIHHILLSHDLSSSSNLECAERFIKTIRLSANNLK